MTSARTISSNKISAGILLFRRKRGSIQVLLGHPGGPFWKQKDFGAWTVPKGLVDLNEDLQAAARREFEEETGYRPVGEFIPLGAAKQPGGKTVHVWAAEGDWNPDALISKCFRNGMAVGFGETSELSRA
ncbi:NUDIX domain-containing protein [Nitrobacter vulgaris]|uniref:NUDIX domain-containing protein n=1 Tax=Nitrobacter vulgaris TaxID=29421 RepID=UPI0026C4B007